MSHTTIIFDAFALERLFTSARFGLFQKTTELNDNSVTRLVHDPGLPYEATPSPMQPHALFVLFHLRLNPVHMLHRYILLLLLCCAFTGCKPDFDHLFEDQVDDPLDNLNNPLRFSDEMYALVSQELDIPQDFHFPMPELSDHMTGISLPSEMPESQQRRALVGRVLFYDTRLSATGETSCATCHQQSFAFGDDKAFSDGIRGAHTDRNSPALGGITFDRVVATANGGGVAGPYSPQTGGSGQSLDNGISLFWDGRARSSIDQLRETISNPIEMGLTPEEMVAKLNREPLYQALSQKAHRTREMNVGNVIQDLTDFMLLMTSTQSRFDEYYDMKLSLATTYDLEQAFTTSELRGAELFEANCTSCHGVKGQRPTVEFANNGLRDYNDDHGRGTITGDPLDLDVFKVPFIRNIPLTAPYMHDGSLATLRDVVDHYSDGVANHPNLNARLKNEDGAPKRLNLSEADKQALVDFLEMAKDTRLMEAEHLSDPFFR